MKEYIFNNVYYFITSWIVFSTIGLWIKLQTEKYLLVADFIWAIMFGPLYFGSWVFELNAIVIDLRPKDKK